MLLGFLCFQAALVYSLFGPIVKFEIPFDFHLGNQKVVTKPITFFITHFKLQQQT